jgi:colanic acid biosynthesis glycosyl transferase WcaI
MRRPVARADPARPAIARKRAAVNIFVWGINYAPEKTGIAPYNTGLCTHLAAAGHDVRMITTFPYYPEWRKSTRSRGRLFHTERIDGVVVHRCWHFVPRRPNAWKRMLHEATFVATGWLRLFTLERPDVLLVVSPPLLLGAAAWLACLLKGCRFVFHVQDLQPDAALVLGFIRPGLLIRLLYAVEQFTYQQAAAVSGITPGMVEMLRRKRVPADKLLLFPNWVEDSVTMPGATAAWRRQVGAPDGVFLAVYSGTLGLKQGLDTVIDAAVLLARDSLSPEKSPGRPPIVIVIAGEGVEKSRLMARVRDERLPNVVFLPLQSTERYHALLAEADVCLVTQQAGSGALFFPSKLLSIVAHRRAVIAVADLHGELERAVVEGGFGWTVHPGQAADLANTLRIAADDAEGRFHRGSLGGDWVRQFARSSVLGSFEIWLRDRFAPASRTRTADGPPPASDVSRQ